MILIKWKLFSLCFINGSKTNYLLDLNHNLYTLKIAETQDEKKKHEQERDFKISAPNKKEVKMKTLKTKYCVNNAQKIKVQT